MTTDHSKMHYQVIYQYVFKTIRIIFKMVIGSYFLGIFYYIYGDLTSSPHSPNFISVYKVNDLPITQASLLLTYFTFSTLTTVGFGDLCPISDPERIFITIVLLFGVAVFSYIFNEFKITLDQVKGLDQEIDDSDDLCNFFVFMRHFNCHEQLDTSLREKIEDYFKYKWAKDKNYILR